MDPKDEDRLNTERILRNRALLSAFFGFFVFIPLPLLLLGYYKIGLLAISLGLAYVYLDPRSLMPSKKTVDELLRGGSSLLSNKSLHANGRYAGRMVNSDPAGQAAPDRLYGDLVGQDEKVISPEAELSAQMQKIHQFRK